MSDFFQKRVDETIECRIDWREGYLQPGERVTRDLGWQVVARPGAGPLAKLHGARTGSQSSAVTVAQGAAGAIYMLMARVMTDTGRILDRAVALRVV